MPIEAGSAIATPRSARISLVAVVPIVALFGTAGRSAPDADPAPAGTILIREWDSARKQYLHATLTPDGNTQLEFATPKDWPAATTVEYPHDVLRSPDGKRAVLIGNDTRPRKEDGSDPPQFPAFLCSFPQGKNLTPFGGNFEPAYWSADAGTLVVREYPADFDTNPGGIGKFVSIELKTGKRTALPIPDEHWLLDRSPDGHRFLTSGKDPDGKLKGNRIFLLDRYGQVVRPLTDETVRVGPAKFGPDGKWVLLRAAQRSAKPVPGTAAWKLYRTAIENPKLELLTAVSDSELVGGFALSPDGKRVAFDRHPRVSVELNPEKVLDPEAETDEVEIAVVVVGLDGKDARTVRSVKTKKPFSIQLQVVDWR